MYPTEDQLPYEGRQSIAVLISIRIRILNLPEVISRRNTGNSSFCEKPEISEVLADEAD